MNIKEKIGEHFDIIGADKKHVGTVDRVEGDKIKLTKTDNGDVKGEHRYIPLDLVRGVKDNKVQLSVNADKAIKMEKAKK